MLETGLEPALSYREQRPQRCAYTNSATPAIYLDLFI